MRHKKKSRLAAAEFLAVLIVTAVVFIKSLSAALAWGIRYMEVVID